MASLWNPSFGIFKSVWRRMKRLTAFVRLILKQPDGAKAGAICIGNDRIEGPVGTAIVSRLSALLLTRVRGHAALHHGISDHTADRHRSTDSIRFQIKTGTSKSTERKNRERRHQEKKAHFCKVMVQSPIQSTKCVNFLTCYHIYQL